MARGDALPIEGVDVSAYTLPTATEFEEDGTLQWDSVTIVVVEVHGGGQTGLGYTYEHEACATLIDRKLAEVITGQDAMQVRARWFEMYRAVRNIGRPGIASRAISAVDVALWDLKARVLDVPVVWLLDQAHDAVPVYGSGGFINYSVAQLREQLGVWADQGIPHVKMKVGRHMNVLEPQDGELVPDTSRPGLGLELKRADAQTYAA